MEILSKLGIDWRLLIAQLVNFAILLYVLRRFAYAPIVRVLDERREKIEKGLRDADMAGEKLLSAEKSTREVIVDARKEAKRIVTESEKSAMKVHDDIVSRAREEATEIMEHMHRSMQVEKARAIEEVRREIGELVITAAQKVAKVSVDAEKEKQYIKELL